MKGENVSKIVDTNSTIEKLENDFWNSPPKNSSSLVTRCYELRKKKLQDFDLSDFRLLIGQNIGLQFLIPLVMGEIKANPFVDADYYEGDLLLNILKSDKKYWESNPEIKKELICIFESERTKLTNELDVTDEIKADLFNAYSNFVKG